MWAPYKVNTLWIGSRWWCNTTEIYMYTQGQLTVLNRVQVAFHPSNWFSWLLYRLQELIYTALLVIQVTDPIKSYSKFKHWWIHELIHPHIRKKSLKPLLQTGIYGCNESFNHKAKDSSKIHTQNGTRHRHTQTYTHAPGYAKSKNTTQNISPNRISSRSGTINVTVCPLVRSFKAFASYKYIYWQYTVSQQHVAAIDWKFQSQPALQRENF